MTPAQARQHAGHFFESGEVLVHRADREPVLAQQRRVADAVALRPLHGLLVEPVPTRLRELELDHEVERHTAVDGLLEARAELHVERGIEVPAIFGLLDRGGGDGDAFGVDERDEGRQQKREHDAMERGTPYGARMQERTEWHRSAHRSKALEGTRFGHGVASAIQVCQFTTIPAKLPAGVGPRQLDNCPTNQLVAWFPGTCAQGLPCRNSRAGIRRPPGRWTTRSLRAPCPQPTTSSPEASETAPGASDAVARASASHTFKDVPPTSPSAPGAGLNARTRREISSAGIDQSIRASALLTFEA